MVEKGSDEAARLAFREIRGILKQHGLGGSVLIHSKDRAFFVRILPDWTALRLSNNQLRVRIKAAEIGKEKAEQIANATAGFVFGMCDLLAAEFTVFKNIAEMLSEHWDVSHEMYDFNPETDQ